jgi:hypothetical protein
MDATPAEKFHEIIDPLFHLWQSARVSGMAVNIVEQWFNIGISVQLLDEPPTSAEIQSPDSQFLYYVMDYPVNRFSDILAQLTDSAAFTLEKTPGGAFAKILLRPTSSTPEKTASQINWYGPTKREPTPQQRAAGVKRTSVTLGAYGVMVNQVLSYDLQQRVDSKLRRADPAFDGLSGLAKHLFQGANFQSWQQTLVEIVAELPFQIELTNTGKLIVCASARSKDNSLIATCFYEPHGGIKPVRSIFRHDTSELRDSRVLQWERMLDWPQGAERAKFTLFYQEEEIQSVQLSRKVQLKASRAKELQTEPGPRVPQAASTTQSTRSPNTSSVRTMPVFNTALERYRALEIVGTGGAGIVYKVETDDHQIFAVKCLDPRRVTTAKRKRFKTELYFCSKNEHKNIITVLGHGSFSIDREDSPFYVMPYYAATLRDLMKAGISREKILPIFLKYSMVSKLPTSKTSGIAI